MRPVSTVVVGAGSRGNIYAHYSQIHPEQLKVVAVAEPREDYNGSFKAKYNIADKNAFRSWEELVLKPRLADAAIIATQDNLHLEPAVELSQKGYHILLEKPMAPNPEDCRQIVTAIKKSGVMFSVCHVLRYTAYTKKIKEIISSGKIGELVCMQRLEPVGYWHAAHSFVRGNWRKVVESSFMLLSKACHDLDWIHYIMGVDCIAVSSFGSLFHFKTGNKPAGAADRCINCSLEATCPFSAIKIYVSRIEQGYRGWPVNVITTDFSKKGIKEALSKGPYGRCVYSCDNDVVDNQVVNMLFKEGQTATFTMTAFTEYASRKTALFGTRGRLEGDGLVIKLYDFLTDKTTVIDTELENTSMQGHGGGDYQIMKHFIKAIAKNDTSYILSGADETLRSHLLVFGAERARIENRVISLE